MNAVIYSCSTCAFTTNNPGSFVNHQSACRRKQGEKRKREEELAALNARENTLNSIFDEKGRKLWKTEHNPYCEMCQEGGTLLMCSYCNCAYHLLHHIPILLEVPSGLWMCMGCVTAEANGEDMTEHFHGDDGGADNGGVADNGVEGGAAHAGENMGMGVDDDEEDNNRDFSDALFRKYGINDIPPGIWDASTAQALERALQPELASEPKELETTVDLMLNQLKSRFKCSDAQMLALDVILGFVMEHPEESFTPFRARARSLSERMQDRSPDVLFEVSEVHLIYFLCVMCVLHLFSICA